MVKVKKELVLKNKTSVVDLAPTSYDSSMGLKKYIKAIQKFPYLTEEEERKLADRYKENEDKEAAKILISSHLRFVVKIAYEYKNYGLPLSDLISEGNLGLMQAMKKFEPEKGFRFSTYAMWWIKAFIQEHVLSNWSTVKIGTSANSKRLFFGLKRTKDLLNVYEDKDLTNEKIKEIAKKLDVSEKDVVNMNSRLYRDYSLNTKTNDDDKSEHLDFLSSSENTEDLVLNKELKESMKDYLIKGLKSLNSREQEIIIKRRLTDEPLTLRELSEKMGISYERIRQIENSAFDKLKKYVLSHSKK